MCIALIWILAATTVVGVYVYAASYVWVYARDYAPPPITGSFPYAGVNVWRYTNNISFGYGNYGGEDPTLNPPYYPGRGVFQVYAWSTSFTDVEYQVKIYKLEGGSWVLICYLQPRGWMWPNGKYDGSYKYSGFVKGGYVK